AYLVAATCAAPVFGQLGDAFGRRRLLFVALGVYAAGCLGCALAPGLPALIGARIVQGFGGGALGAQAPRIRLDKTRPARAGMNRMPDCREPIMMSPLDERAK
ncbi:MAG: MFS transporter, partial [Parvularculaceae bacterium]